MFNYIQFLLESEKDNLGFDLEPVGDKTLVPKYGAFGKGETAQDLIDSEEEDWRRNSTAFLFILRQKQVSPDNWKEMSGNPWYIDSWLKVDYSQPKEMSGNYHGMKLRAQFNNSYLYGVWMPNEIADDVDENPDDYLDLIMKYKFKV